MSTSPTPTPEEMDNRTALHTAARRFCEDRFAEWTTLYADVEKKESSKAEPGWDYSKEAYEIFPRYRFDKAAKVEVERLVPQASASLGELRSLLLTAADVAAQRLCGELKNEIAIEAVRKESEDYKAYVSLLKERDLLNIAPLPYRRVLTASESQGLWKRLGTAWNIGEGYWFPLKEGPAPANLMAFHVDYFTAIQGNSLLRNALRVRGISRVFEIHEFGPDEPDCEIELSIFDPGYRWGGEQYCTTEEIDWVVYASHESSITVGGDWLLQILKREQPKCTESTYRGPYSTEDMRGSWETK